MIKFINRTLILFILFISLSFQPSLTQIHVPHSQIQQALKSQDASKNLDVDQDYGKMPLYFIPNEGQVDDKALFYAKTSRYKLWLTKQGLVFDSSRRIGKTDTESKHKDPRGRVNPGDAKYERDISRIVFLNANKSPEVIPMSKTEHQVNYFIGYDKSQWKTDVQTSKAVLYKNLYENIDLKVYGVEKEIEYDWFVRPGGEVEDIRFEYTGAKGTRINADGNLLVETEFGELMHRKPESYQVIEGEKSEVEVTFIEIDENIFGFDAGSYREDHDLVIDPVILVYSTYLVWNDLSPGKYEIFHKWSTNAGGTWKAKRLSWNGGASTVAEITTYSNSEIHIVWADNSPGNNKIYYKKRIQ